MRYFNWLFNVLSKKHDRAHRTSYEEVLSCIEIS